MRLGLVIEVWIIVWPLGYLELFQDIPPWRVHEGITSIARHMLPARGVAFVLKPVFEGHGITVGVGFHRRPHTSVSVPISDFHSASWMKKAAMFFAPRSRYQGLFAYCAL